jgi:hypothetical protein
MPYYERHLPHWQPEEAWLFITWRLAGSLPANAIHTLAAVTPGNAFLSLDRILDQAGSGPVWLQNPDVASAVCDAIRQAESSRQFMHAGWLCSDEQPRSFACPAAGDAREVNPLGQGRIRPGCLSDFEQDGEIILAARILRPMGAGFARV